MSKKNFFAWRVGQWYQKSLVNILGKKKWHHKRGPNGLHSSFIARKNEGKMVQASRQSRKKIKCEKGFSLLSKNMRVKVHNNRKILTNKSNIQHPIIIISLCRNKSGPGQVKKYLGVFLLLPHHYHLSIYLVACNASMLSGINIPPFCHFKC